jgi:hypothetical protein
MIPWSAGGHADAWNHVEAAMALSAAGDVDAATRAYRWLHDVQLADGSFYAFYGADGAPSETRRETNPVAYLACGLAQHLACTDDAAFVWECSPMLWRALDFVLAHERPDGGFTWSIEQDGTPGAFALLAASSSIHQSLWCAASLAERLGRDPRPYVAAARRTGAAIRRHPERFEDKSVFAMDWYYPVLGGAVVGRAARERLREGWTRFVEPGHGVRCRSDGGWVTAAESAECAIACLRAGEPGLARTVLAWSGELRRPSGAVLTGRVWPEGSTFPVEEETTYSAAAVVLAADVLVGGPTASVFAPGTRRMSTRRLAQLTSSSSSNAPESSASR